MACGKRNRSGAAATELAILLPFLALVFAAVLDVARVFHAVQVLDSAAASGAAFASGTAWSANYPTGAADAAKAAAVAEGAGLRPALGDSNVTVTIAGGTATVVVETDFPLFTGFLFDNGGVHLKRSAVSSVAPRPGD